jgi:hypothetical protein
VADRISHRPPWRREARGKEEGEALLAGAGFNQAGNGGAELWPEVQDENVPRGEVGGVVENRGVYSEEEVLQGGEALLPREGSHSGNALLLPTPTGVIPLDEDPGRMGWELYLRLGAAVETPRSVGSTSACLWLGRECFGPAGTVIPEFSLAGGIPAPPGSAWTRWRLRWGSRRACSGGTG